MKLQIRYIYVLFIPNVRYLYRAKIGISNDVTRRIKEIRDSIYAETRREVPLKALIKIPLLASEKWETQIHRLTRRLRATMPGNGHTEWRWYLNPILALLAGHYGGDLPGANLDVIRFLVVLLLPLPLDLALLTVVVFCLEFSLLMLTLYALAQLTNILLQTFL